MNLTNLFNFKYLMQNIKKSKGLIILLTLLVPMFTSIILLSAEGDYAISFLELSAVNLICMYIVPIVLSITLFNYVYKKSSVDFIGSMPLSRKTIFLTNTIGGIAIIAITQLLTMISTLFLSKILSGIVIFGSMVWDIFIFYTISYIFVFTVSNLAMSFSGNKFAQLVVICLILFLIPFLVMSGDLLGDDYSYISIEDDLAGNSLNRIGEKIKIDQTYNFTAPSMIFDMLINGEDIYEYNATSVFKMSVLSIIYIIIGLILFKKKKLEMAGESFENINIHLIIKMLTFAPFMFVFCSLNSNDRVGVLLFFIAILAVYYFIFDLITNKKIKIKVSIPVFIVSAIVMFAIYEGIIPQFGRDNSKVVYVEDIQSVYIDSINKNYSSTCKFDLAVEDKELIKSIVKSEENEPIYYEDYYYTSSKEISSIDIYQSNDIAVIPNQKNAKKYKGSNAKLTIKLNNGKTYAFTKYISDNTYEKIIEKYGDKKAVIDVKNFVSLASMNLTKEERKDIIEIVKKELENVTYEQLYKMYNGERAEYTLNLYEYKNHKLIANNFALQDFKNLYKKMITISNNDTLKCLEEISRFYMLDIDEWRNIIAKKNPSLFMNTTASGDSVMDNEDSKLIEIEKIQSELLYDIIRQSTDEIITFIKEDIKNDVDITKDYIVIRSNYPTYYYTNNIDGFYKIIAKSFNNNLNYTIKLNEI